ncbi:MAG TPA: hypothetical protein VFS23_06375, partial [Vicinamibacterales bacterium]|nr:hypothetical protein [Vicinamibacterales bacterium]
MGREWLQMIEAKLDREIGEGVSDWLKRGMFRLCWAGSDIWTVRFAVEDSPTEHSPQFESFR